MRPTWAPGMPPLSQTKRRMSPLPMRGGSGSRRREGMRGLGEKGENATRVFYCDLPGRTCAENASRIQNRNTGENFALLRKMSLGLLKQTFPRLHNLPLGQRIAARADSGTASLTFRP